MPMNDIDKVKCTIVHIVRWLLSESFIELPTKGNCGKREYIVSMNLESCCIDLSLFSLSLVLLEKTYVEFVSRRSAFSVSRV
jgi:hypothetical protein